MRGVLMACRVERTAVLPDSEQAAVPAPSWGEADFTKFGRPAITTCYNDITLNFGSPTEKQHGPKSKGKS